MPCEQTFVIQSYYLSAHVSGIARTAVSFSGYILNNRESNKIYFFDSVSNFLMANFELGSYFVAGIDINL